MPWKTRDDQKRKLSAVATGIDSHLLTLKNFIELYGPDHKELAAHAEAIAGVLVLAQQNLVKLKDSF